MFALRIFHDHVITPAHYASQARPTTRCSIWGVLPHLTNGTMHLINQASQDTCCITFSTFLTRNHAIKSSCPNSFYFVYHVHYRLQHLPVPSLVNLIHNLFLSRPILILSYHPCMFPNWSLLISWLMLHIPFIFDFIILKYHVRSTNYEAHHYENILHPPLRMAQILP